MRKLLLLGLALAFAFSLASADNRAVFGPLNGDDAGVLAVHPGDAVDVEIWVRTDTNNPAPVYGVNHSLMTDDVVIAERDSGAFDPAFAMPNWEQTFWDGPYIHNGGDPFPIPAGHTSECMVALYQVFGNPPGDPLDTDGEWVHYGAFHMVCAAEVPGGEYEPFAEGWYPHSGQGTSWSFQVPPGGSVVPDEDYATVMVQTGIDDGDALPMDFSLKQNYPNPFNASTTIKFSLPEASDVSIQIFDILGRHIQTLVSGNQPAGEHSIVWNAGNQPSGVYFYKIQAGNFTDQKSCLLLK
jgi:hypothetical protein